LIEYLLLVKVFDYGRKVLWMKDYERIEKNKIEKIFKQFV